MSLHPYSHTGRLAGLQTCQTHTCPRTLHWLLSQFLPKASPSLPTAFNWSSAQPPLQHSHALSLLCFLSKHFHLLTHPVFYLFILFIICLLVLEHKVPRASFTHDSVLQFLGQGLAHGKYSEVSQSDKGKLTLDWFWQKKHSLRDLIWSLVHLLNICLFLLER